MKKYILLLFCLLMLPYRVMAMDFNEVFSDSTLRVDYVFGGGPHGNYIFLENQTKQAGWFGRTSRLKETPLAGNGNILVKDPTTGDTLYNNSFSTLFLEWIATPEAQIVSKSFENSFIVPLPKKEVDITVTLRDNIEKEIASLTHRYRPDDELVMKVKHEPLPHKYIHCGGDSRHAIDLAILAEGYTEDEMDSFLQRAEEISNEILSYEPFASNKDKFNIVAVMSASPESGVTIPKKEKWKNTRYDSHFSTFYSDRYLTSPRVWKMHQDLEGIPYEYVLMLVNTDEYGGGGIYNSYQIAAADNSLRLPVAVHEFGHSFGGLADEYDYGDDDGLVYADDVEPWEPNITTLVNFERKWNGEVFEGAGYRKKGVYRPSETCRMRDNYFPTFCKVCETSLQETIDFYTE